MKSILFIGNHLSNSNKNTGVSEILSQKLSNNRWAVINTSHYENKFLRILDMLITILLKRKKYSIAHIDVFSGSAFIWAFLSAFLLHIIKKKYILTLRGGNLPKFSMRRNKFVQYILNNAEVITSPSNYLIANLSKLDQQIILIPNAIEISKYEYFVKNFRESNIIWLRAFHNIYNPALVPKVMYLLKRDFQSLKVIMVGPDKKDGSLQNMVLLANKLEVIESIEIIPGIPKSQVPSVLKKENIFLNTTNIDNTPVSVIEAMACGLCIVSTNVGGIPYLLEDGFDSLLVPPDDPGAMAAAIQRILTEPELAARLSANARKKAESFDWVIILPQWEKLFQEAMSYNENN